MPTQSVAVRPRKQVEPEVDRGEAFARFEPAPAETEQGVAGAQLALSPSPGRGKKGAEVGGDEPLEATRLVPRVAHWLDVVAAQAVVLSMLLRGQSRTRPAQARGEQALLGRWAPAGPGSD